MLGLAAGLFAGDPDAFGSFAPTMPRLEVDVDGVEASPAPALVDLAVVDEQWVGARAMWDERLLVEAVVTRADPTLCGLAGLAGMVAGTDPAATATHLCFGSPGLRVLGPLGPGQLVTADLARVSTLSAGDEVTVGGDRVTLAFDGERERVLQPDQRARVRVLAEGPRSIDAAALVRAAAADGAFSRSTTGGTGAELGTEGTDGRRRHAYE